jgi:protein disulfide-isomerase-like protein
VLFLSEPTDAKSKGCPSSEFYGSTAVVDVCDFNFPDSKDENVWLIEFYAPWCGHCQALKPTYIDTAKMLKKSNEEGLRIGAVNCVEEQSLCAKYGIKGYPTLKAFANGKGKSYNGPREKDDMIRFLKDVRDRKGTKGGSSKCSSSLYDSNKKDAVALCESHFPDKKSKNSWVILFHPTISEKAKAKSIKKEIYSLASTVASGGAKFGIVDCGKEDAFCDKILGSTKPESEDIIVKTFKKGDKQLSEKTFTEGLGNEDSVIEFIKEQLGSKFKISKPANEEL